MREWSSGIYIVEILISCPEAVVCLYRYVIEHSQIGLKCHLSLLVTVICTFIKKLYPYKFVKG